MPLTVAEIRAARPKLKSYKLFDEKGLYLLVDPRGGRYWRFKYRIQGSEKLLSVGVYPDVSLKLARERREAARKLVAMGVDPSTKRQAEKLARADTFEAVALEWLELQRAKLAPKSLERIRDRLQSFVFRPLGQRPIASIRPVELLATLRPIETRGRCETAHRTRSDCSRVFRYAIACGRAERDITVDLRGALAPVKKQNFAALTTPAAVGALLRAIEGYQGQPATEIALKLAPYLFVRPGELRAAEWRIPAARTKMRRAHIVPLARQVLALLAQLDTFTGGGRLLFPTLQDPNRPMSDNTLNAALRRLGYTSEQHTAHGFRTTASTLLNEQGFHPDLIELQLAHKERNKTRATYNKSERLPERRAMMQQWARYLDALREGARVSAIRGADRRGHY